MTTDTQYILLTIALLTLVVGIFAYDYRLEMRRARAVERLAEACSECLEASGGTIGACSVVCGRLDQRPRASPKNRDATPPAVGVGLGKQRAGGGAPAANRE